MSWSRYDDELPMNRKVAWLKSHGVDGIAALGLHLLANTWSRHEGHQGFIPDYIPEQLVGRPWRKLTDLLADEAIGMFQPVDHGWMINDYENFGDRDDGVPVEEKKARLSKVRAEAGRAGGKAKASKSASKRVAQLEANGKQSSSPVPVPDPGSSSVALEGGGSVLREPQAPHPINLSKQCRLHPDGTDEPCGTCAEVRKGRERETADREKRQSAEKTQQAALRLACTDCDEYGWILDAAHHPIRRCGHPRASVAQPESRTA